MKIHRENLLVLSSSFGLMLLETVLPDSGYLLKRGLFIFALIFLWKGMSRLRCKTSDVVIALCAFVLSVAARLVTVVSPLWFEIATLVLGGVFLFTGLSLKEISAERRGRRTTAA